MALLAPGTFTSTPQLVPSGPRNGFIFMIESYWLFAIGR